ncbi:MAG: tetratricopeptide repeat protein [Cyanobacteriota bacterium]
MRKTRIKKIFLFVFIALTLCLNTMQAKAVQINLPNDIIENIDSRFMSIYVSYGDGYANKEEYDLAEGFYRKAIDLEPGNIKAKYRLGLVLEMQKKYPEAGEIYTAIIKDKSDEMQAYYSLGLVLDQQGKSIEGIEKLNKALEFEPDNAFINYDIGVVYAKLRDFPQSKLYSARAAELKPDFSEALNNLCYAQGNIGEYADAIKNCEKSLELKPNSAATIDSLGFAYYGMGKVDTAIEKYLEALQYDNTIGEIYFHLGESYDLNKIYPEALYSYIKYLELEQDAYNKDKIDKRISELNKIVSKEELEKARESIEDKIKPAFKSKGTYSFGNTINEDDLPVKEGDDSEPTNQIQDESGTPADQNQENIQEEPNNQNDEEIEEIEIEIPEGSDDQ